MERRLGHPEAARTPGPDLLLAVLERGEPLGLRHYLLGSTHETVDRLRARLRRRFPQALVVGASSPTIGKDVAPLPDLVEEIRRHTPDIVWCALGAPKQEIWMHLHHEALAPALLVGVGAAFDFTAGTKRRAPAYLQRLGLEWLHRFAAEPRRLGGRYLRTNAEFIFRAGFELLRETPR